MDEKKGSVLLVVGASAGGNAVLPELLRQLTPAMDVITLVVVHLSRISIGELLVARLQKHTSLTCEMASDGEEMKKGHVYLARPDRHLMVNKGRLLVGQGPMENRYRPSIDALFRSAAVEAGPRVIGIILSGMLEDGASGMLAIRKCGGACIIQDPGEAKFPDMPRAVLNILKPDYSVPISEMGPAILESLKVLKRKKAVTIPEDVVREALIAERVNIGLENVQGLGTISSVTCPDCGGSLREINENGYTRYRCHVGHAFSEEGLLSGMEVSTESSLWVAVRILEERRNLLRQIGEKESRKGKEQLAQSYLGRSEELGEHAEKLKEILFKVSGRDSASPET